MAGNQEAEADATWRRVRSSSLVGQRVKIDTEILKCEGVVNVDIGNGTVQIFVDTPGFVTTAIVSKELAKTLP